MALRIKVIGLVYAILIPLTSLAQSDDDRFIEAKKAAQRGDWAQFSILKNQLVGYPLRLYLEYYDLQNNFKTVDDHALQSYLDKYPNSPTAEELREKWLMALAEKQYWEQFLRLYTPTNNVTLKCYYLRALQQTGKAEQAYSQIMPLWLTGQSQPNNCNNIFDMWLEQNLEKNTLIWQRFELALKNYNFGLATHLSEKLPEHDKNQAVSIIKLYTQPNLVTQRDYLNNQPSADVVSYGIARIAHRNPALAIKTWERLRKHYYFNEKQQQRIFQSIALKLALRKDRNSILWFRKIVGKPLDPVYQEWMIRSALFHNDWKLVKDSIEALRSEDRQSARWQYWYARALDKLGNHNDARQIFANIANERSYYGFLASRYNQQNIQVRHHMPVVSNEEIETVKQLSGFQRAALLYKLNQDHYAKQELYYLMKYVTSMQQYIVAKLVSLWGWHSQALFLSRDVEYKDDIILRFPLNYYAAVTQNASQRNLNPALIYAIILQESYFTPNANSSAGAIGLMQLMPTTAAKVSKHFGFKYESSKDLFNTDTNIIFGCAYLQKLHQNFNHHPILVIAAYNAGRDAVNRWLPKNKEIPADIWIETIPFYETRNYIKNIIAYYVVYQYRLGQQPSLENIMLNVK